MKSLRSFLAASLLAAPAVSHASVVTVWDNFDGSPIGAGMTIGLGLQGIQFVPSATGYLADFTFGGWQFQGTADWVFTLRTDVGGLPSATLETLPPTDVQYPVGGDPPSPYTVTASQTSLLVSGISYWLIAELPSGSLGGWSRIETGTSKRVYCYPNCITVDDQFAGAVEIRVETNPIAPVPLPAAAWLLLSGLGGMGFLSRRKRAVQL